MNEADAHPLKSDSGGRGLSSPPCQMHEFQDWCLGEGPSDNKGLVRVRHISEPPLEEDGERYFIERQWPEDVKRTGLRLSGWLDVLAPDDALKDAIESRTLQAEPPCMRYRMALLANRPALDPLLAAMRRGPVTLLHFSNHRTQNHAILLRDLLIECARDSQPHSPTRPIS